MDSALRRLLSWIGSIAVISLVSPDPVSSQQTTVKIASSFPISGPAAGEGLTVVNAIRQAIDKRGGVVCNGQIKVVYQSYDDAAFGKTSDWDPDQVEKNAKAIVKDPQVVALIGHNNSGASAIGIPIYNQADLVVVSPSSTYPGLTKPGMGEPDEPDKYYPTGVRNFARVIPTEMISREPLRRDGHNL
jgi:branched-chain amino acid transport system substrate-binding protein